MDTYPAAVRAMVEFISRSGDIDTAFISQHRALDGTRVHQRIGRRRKKEAADGAYYTEVVLDTTREHKGIAFQLKGRADGVWVRADGAVVLEEYKSTLAPLETLRVDDGHWHWAQAKCYGYMYLLTRDAQDDGADGLEGLTVTLVYGQIDSEETRSFSRYGTRAELAAFFDALLDAYWPYARLDLDRRAERGATARGLAFPFTYRPGQRELAVSVYAAVKRQRKLFAQAPTGIGKTLSVLFPAVKALAEGCGDTIFYLTAKTVARQVAEEAFRHMAEAGLVMRVLTLTAKDKLCPCETRVCDPDRCDRADGHFDRVNAALLDILTRERSITRAVVESYARRHRVCPAEYQLDAALFCDAVIGDYNHAYDPKAKLQRFFAYGGDYILLNDEAHNLIDRARDMFSADLYRKDFAALRKALGKGHPLYKNLGAIAKEIRRLCGQEPTAFCRAEKPEELQALLLAFAQDGGAFLQEHREPPPDALLGVYFGVLDYLRTAEAYDQRYTTFCEPKAGRLRLYCLDPSFQLAQAQKKARASVFFSATLAPLDYFREVLGGDEEDFTLRLASPFARGNLCLLVEDRVSTRYTRREESCEAIADRLAGMARAKTGNYMAFFPSYAYLNAVYAVFTDKHPDIRALAQSQDMDDAGRDAFLAAFDPAPAETLLAFAALGGAFSEGIDLKGERLSGAAVVGVGLPMVCAERDVLLEYYNRAGRDGFAFAYRYPGMNKVLQAAGRVIRTETDRGVVLLIDSRFSESAYRGLFPPEWAGYGRARDGERLRAMLAGFWEG